MNKYLVILGLLATHADANEMRTLCEQQANLVEFMMAVRKDGFARDGVEAELQKRYPNAPANYWQQPVSQHLLKFTYNTDGLKPAAAREYFFNVCLTEITDIDSPATSAALFNVAKDCQQQFDTDKAKIKACVDTAAEPVLMAAWQAKPRAGE
jgi:hypothetical protein